MFGKEKTFQEITGMTEEEFRAQSEEFKTLKAAREADSTKLTEQENAITELRNSLQALSKPPEKKEEGSTAPTSIYADEDRAWQERLGPLAVANFKTAARLEELEARSRHAMEYKLWGKEIDEMVKGHQNLADKSNPALYDNIVNIIRGKHMDEILEAERKGQSLFTESASGHSIGGSATDTTFGLTPEQLDAARKQGIPPEEFAKNYRDLMEARGIRVANA